MNRDPPWASSGNRPIPPVALGRDGLEKGKPIPAAGPAKKGLGWKRILLVPVAGFALWLTYQFATLPDVTPLADHNPEITAAMRERAAAVAAEGKRPRHRQYWVELSSISPRAVDAVLASEDSSFYLHHGIDLEELKKVAAQAWEKRSLGRGASTITQQLAKNLWLSGDRSLVRKAKEMLLARRLEETLPKKRILALYLNVVEWGDGVYGIEAGAREHFGVSARQLSVAQGAMLASMLPAPRRWTPENRSRALRKRALWVVDRLEEWSKISPEDAAAARKEIEQRLNSSPRSPEEVNAADDGP